jgi:hypothetical protein
LTAIARRRHTQETSRGEAGRGSHLSSHRCCVGKVVRGAGECPDNSQSALPRPSPNQGRRECHEIIFRAGCPRAVCCTGTHYLRGVGAGRGLIKVQVCRKPAGRPGTLRAIASSSQVTWHLDFQSIARCIAPRARAKRHLAPRHGDTERCHASGAGCRTRRPRRARQGWRSRCRVVHECNAGGVSWGASGRAGRIVRQPLSKCTGTCQQDSDVPLGLTQRLPTVIACRQAARGGVPFQSYS